MSDFVNFKKRSVTLPRGCKNLVELLSPQERQKLQSTTEFAQRLTVTCHESVSGTVSDVAKYVAKVFESREPMFTLWITTPDERLTVMVARMWAGTPSASVTVQEHTDQQKAVHSFFLRRGLHVPDDTMTPPSFVPDLPVQIRYDISPMPLEAPSLATLLLDLFRESCGPEESGKLRFDCALT